MQLHLLLPGYVITANLDLVAKIGDYQLREVTSGGEYVGNDGKIIKSLHFGR